MDDNKFKKITNQIRYGRIPARLGYRITKEQYLIIHNLSLVFVLGNSKAVNSQTFLINEAMKLAEWQKAISPNEE